MHLNISNIWIVMCLKDLYPIHLHKLGPIKQFMIKLPTLGIFPYILFFSYIPPNPRSYHILIILLKFISCNIICVGFPNRSISPNWHLSNINRSFHIFLYFLGSIIKLTILFNSIRNCLNSIHQRVMSYIDGFLISMSPNTLNCLVSFRLFTATISFLFSHDIPPLIDLCYLKYLKLCFLHSTAFELIQI